jgi:hypothetical protein
MKEIAYFKTIKGRNAGKVFAHIYYALREDGTIRVIDVTRKITKTCRGFGSFPFTLEISSEAEFNLAYELTKTF